MKFFRMCFLLLIPCWATAQLQDFAGDMPFFQHKQQHYQRWLDSLGLSPKLRVADVRFQVEEHTSLPDTRELELLLVLQATHPDTAAAQWVQLSDAYESASGRSLKTALFSTFVHQMEIPAAQGNVQIYGAGSGGNALSPCFFVWLWSEAGVLKDSLQPNTCKSQVFSITLPPATLKTTTKNGKNVTVTKVASANTVFDLVLRFARERYPYNKYLNTDCSGRFPIVEEESRTNDELKFTVTDLCREVLSNGSLSTWCWLARKSGWEKDCNDIRRERLTFTLKYVPMNNGYQLQCHLEGKFGSAAYWPRSGDYYDMVPDFEGFEKDFAETFKKALEKYLSTAKP